jgi:hypothetical protein
MPSVTLKRKINYLVNWLDHLYEIEIPANRWINNPGVRETQEAYIQETENGSVERIIHKPPLETTKPCADVLANSNATGISNTEKVNAILDYLNTQCQRNSTTSNINSF